MRELLPGDARRGSQKPENNLAARQVAFHAESVQRQQVVESEAEDAHRCVPGLTSAKVPE